MTESAMETSMLDRVRPAMALDLPPADAGWHLPIHGPAIRENQCALAQPVLRRAQATPNFVFHDATLVLVASGSLALKNSDTDLTIDDGHSLLLVERGTWANLKKTPSEAQRCFRSVFLTFNVETVEHFWRDATVAGRPPCAPIQQTPLDDELASTLRWVCASVSNDQVSDGRLRYRLLDLLAALAERGIGYGQPRSPSTSERVRMLLSRNPERSWTAREAGHELAMSEATLRRRLAHERTRFDVLLVDVRMHHGLMLLQTTHWNIARVAEACGYLSRARFAIRFQQRFGTLPSEVR